MKARSLYLPVVAIVFLSYLTTSFEISENSCSYSTSENYKSFVLFGDSIKVEKQHPTVLLYAKIDTDSINKTDDNGLKQGHWIIYGNMKPDKGYCDSCLIEQGPYKDNRKEGTWIKYHKDGKTPRLIGKYVNGRPNGAYTKYYDGGVIMESGEYSGGKQKGEFKRYSANGTVSQSANYSGRSDGQVAYYFDSGSSNFVFGSPQGNAGNGAGNTATRYYPNGDTKRVVPYTSRVQSNDIAKISNKKNKRELESTNGFLWAGEDSISVTTNHNNDNGLASQTTKKDRIPDVATAYERYNPFTENEWVKSAKEAKSTFSIDVDNAAYTNFRRFVNQGQLPPKDAIRVEEWLNFFNYELKVPAESDPHPMNITSEIGACPWAPEDDLVMIKMQGKKAIEKDLPPSNLVFLVDVSGSMNSPNKLPLVQESMIQLVKKLRPQDKMSIVKYAGSSGIVLKPTPGDQKQTILDAIDGLTSGGGTAGSKGIETAYKLAVDNFVPLGNNRVIVATDGDWNIGIRDDEELKKLIEKKRELGVYLSVLGFGMRNLNDQMMETLADNGNGNYCYVDSKKESNRIFNTEFAGSMYVIAKDVKLQIQFDSTVVQEYRLLGYENRVLENWQFEADSIDAGDLGMGQNVVAFYQIKRKPGASRPMGKLDFRYKPIDSDVSTLLSHEFKDRSEELSSDYNFASCVIEFAMCLRESEFRGDAQMSRAITRGRQNLGNEGLKLSHEKRVEFVGLMEESFKMWEGYVFEDAPELEIQDTPTLKMYPNPATDFVTIEVPEDKSESWSVQVFDMNGKLKTVEHFFETNSGRIDVNDYEPNTYIVKVYSGGSSYGYLRLVVN